jgi:hypothetical protein
MGDRVGWLIGLLGIVVGLGGIYVTAITSADALNALAELVSGSDTRPQFKSLAGTLQFFGIGLIITTCYAFFGIGLAAVGRPILEAMGAQNPTWAAVSLVFSLTSFAAAIASVGYTPLLTIAAIGIGLWFLLLMVLSSINYSFEDDFPGQMIFGTILIVVACVGLAWTTETVGR